MAESSLQPLSPLEACLPTESLVQLLIKDSDLLLVDSNDLSIGKPAGHKQQRINCFVDEKRMAMAA